MSLRSDVGRDNAPAMNPNVRGGAIMLSRRARIVLFNCATGLKYPLPPAEQRLDRYAPIDYGRFQ